MKILPYLCGMTEDELLVLERIRKRNKTKATHIDYCYLISIINGIKYYQYGHSKCIYGYYGYPSLVSIGKNSKMSYIDGSATFKYFLLKERESKKSSLAKSLGLEHTKDIIGCTLAYNIDENGLINEISYLSIGLDKNDDAYELTKDQLTTIDQSIIRKRKVGLEFVKNHGGKKITLISCSSQVYNTQPCLYYDCPKYDIHSKWLLGFDYLDRPYMVKGHYERKFMRNRKIDQPFIDIIEKRLKQY